MRACRSGTSSVSRSACCRSRIAMGSRPARGSKAAWLVRGMRLRWSRPCSRRAEGWTHGRAVHMSPDGPFGAQASLYDAGGVAFLPCSSASLTRDPRRGGSVVSGTGDECPARVPGAAPIRGDSCAPETRATLAIRANSVRGGSGLPSADPATIQRTEGHGTRVARARGITQYSRDRRSCSPWRWPW